MVDPDLLRRASERVLHHIARLRRHHDLTAAELDADEDRCQALAMDLQQAIQGCIDLAVHTCAGEGLGALAGPAEAFQLLARNRRITPDLAVRLAGAADLTNIIVHRYTELDSARVLSVIRNDLQDLEALIAAVRA